MTKNQAHSLPDSAAAPAPRLAPGLKQRIALRWFGPVRRQWLGRVRALLAVVIACVLAFALVMILVVVQGGYTDARQVGAIMVLNTGCERIPEPQALCPQEQQLAYALDLYRRGYASHLVLLSHSTNAAAVRAYFQKQGLADGSLLLEDQGTTQWQQIRSASELARNNGVNSVLLVGTRSQMLLGLKMTHDLGLAAFGTPLPAQARENFFTTVGDVLHEAFAYWRYVLIQQ